MIFDEDLRGRIPAESTIRMVVFRGAGSESVRPSVTGNQRP